MVIILTKTILEVILPLTLGIVLAFMPIFIMALGFLILLRVIGIRISINSMVNAIFRVIGSIGRQFWKLFVALVLIIANWLPKVFYGVRRICITKGATPILSNIVAILVVFVLVVIII